MKLIHASIAIIALFISTMFAINRKFDEAIYAILLGNWYMDLYRDELREEKRNAVNEKQK